jgi:hypothetical protein
MVNTTATRLKGVDAFFNLHSISVKPIAMPTDSDPIIANVTIRGWHADSESADDPLVFGVQWTSGYTAPLLIDLDSKHFSEYKWQALRWLDFAVDFGPDQLDWEFCLDDLLVGFAQRDQGTGEDSTEQRMGRQAASNEWEDL